MAPAPDQFSAPGSVSYDADTMVVGDGTWDFSKNTFLLPPLVGPNFDTMRYNGMGNRFSTLTEYHPLIMGHGILAAMVFLFILPFSIMTARFYNSRPGWAVKYHAQMNIFAGLLLLAVFILGFMAVGPERSLSNPHHGIGVAIFVMLILQLVGGRLVRHITKSRSLRITIHQWSGRAIALLGIAQIPLGLTLYGSPLYLFILYAVWMAILLVIYFILNYQSESRRELIMSGARSEAGHTRVTESEYFASEHNKPAREGGWTKWLGPAAAGAGLFALMRGRNRDRARERSRSRSFSRSRGPEVLPSRRGSVSYVEDEKYSAVRPQKASGGGFMRGLGGLAAFVGAGKLLSNMGKRRDGRRDDDYSAVSTETPRRHRPTRGAMTASEYGTEMMTDIGPDGTESSFMPPSANPPAMAAAMSAANQRAGSHRPTTPRARQYHTARSALEESEYSSYVSPSRRTQPVERSGGFGTSILAGLGLGWLAKRMADRRAKKEEQQRLRDEEDLQSGILSSRYTGDGYPSPTRPSRKAPRRPTGMTEDSVISELTESSIDSRPIGRAHPPQPPPIPPSTMPPSTRPSTQGTIIPSGAPPVPVSHHSRSRSTSRHPIEPVGMPPIPPDPHGILYSEAEQSRMSLDSRPTRRTSSRRREDGDRAAAAAAARAEGLATDEDRLHRAERERYGSPQSQSISMKLKVHDKDRISLRRLTDEERAAERRVEEAESSISGIESPTSNRKRYRREVSQRRAEAAAEQKVEEEADALSPLPVPDPAFARGRRGGNKDSAYYSGQPGPSGSTPAAGQTMSSLGSFAMSDGHGTWSGMSASPSAAADPAGSAAADNRRRRRLERRRGSSSRPVGPDMYD